MHSSRSSLRILSFGAGAIGTYIGGSLALSGHKVIFLERPDVVLLDLKMPGLSGIETLEQIRKIEPDIPVIILTGHGDFDSA
ncbi:MAG: response regulator, partial [Anaerolineales bacterium]|nr:response regulator [Anaerolineales bacterium]